MKDFIIRWRIMFFLLWTSIVHAQEINQLYIRQTLPKQDTIRLNDKNINPSFLELYNLEGELIPPEYYQADYINGRIVLSKELPTDSLRIHYLKWPDFLTRTYGAYDNQKPISQEAYKGMMYAFDLGTPKKFVPFEGLQTSGSISRGIRVGNNQNAVTSSSLDLQISGKLSDKVNIRASIQDSNIPIQEGGYSQKLDEFDQVFIELFSDKWSIKAGDLFLENKNSRFMNFNKKVQGVSTEFSFGNPDKQTTILSSAALVKGKYARTSFTGTEGNQGPYKLKGSRGELYVLVVSGSERVYVNGILLERGEDKHYIIDYNAGEVTFTSLFPITSEMRIQIEYQFSEQSYTRFIAYGGIMHQQDNWKIGGFLYSENDMKNQSLQQSLTSEQIQILRNAGNDPEQMVAPSAYPDSYSPNKILYKKTMIDGIEVFEFSNNPQDQLYNVRFMHVGTHKGNYVLQNSMTVGKIYAYVAPIGGLPQGDYEPIIRLTAPEKLQIATILGGYHSERTQADFEVAVSHNDKNLFSDKDNGDNDGYATKVDFTQNIIKGKYLTDVFIKHQFIGKNFNTIERLFGIEFDRDWNVGIVQKSNQSLLETGFKTRINNRSFLKYSFEKLDFLDNLNANRNTILGQIRLKRWSLSSESSYLKNNNTYADSRFFRTQNQLRYHFGKNWVGGSFRVEDNSEQLKSTGLLSGLSQKFIEYGSFIGRGDSTKVYAELGYLHRTNDSLNHQIVQRVSHSHSVYFKSRLLVDKQRELSVFANYRKLRSHSHDTPSEQSLNSRVQYNDVYFGQMVQLNTMFETLSGNLPQQEFTYVEVESGQGVYMWTDYNGNGIQELEEFEVAAFPDQAKYIRVFLPNQIYLKIHQNRFSQSLTLNPSVWQNHTGLRKTLSYFYNQTSFVTDRKVFRDQSHFDLNPFGADSESVLGQNTSLRNSFFYNRGKQQHSVVYTYWYGLNKNLLSVGAVSNKTDLHKLQYTHLLSGIWLLNMELKTQNNESYSENYESRNYNIDTYALQPKISYLFDQNTNLDLFFQYQYKQNQIGSQELLNQQQIGLSFAYSGRKGFTATGTFSLYDNHFVGNAMSPAAYQILEGLQPGKNQRWQLLLQKNLTQYLDLNLSYEGRKSETSQTIHTGTIQLRAFF